MFLMRFDMRAPGGGAEEKRDLYRAAIEMAAWGEKHGCSSVVVCEHHASPDGYLPSPLVLASAMAARTTTLPIQVAAILIPFYDPIRLAEDMAVLDIVSEGRVSYVCGLGYRPEEYAMFGVPMKGRGRHMDKCMDALRKSWAGEPFEFEGRPVHVTPTPLTAGGPPLLMGGNSRAAARRAARFGMGLLAQGGDQSMEQVYREECEKLGVEPGMCIVPPDGIITCGVIAEDPDRAWQEFGPHMLHDATVYAKWNQGYLSAPISRATSIDELRAQGGPYAILTPDQAVDYIKKNGFLLMQPLVGGTPPELAWKSLELLAGEVLPAVT